MIDPDPRIFPYQIPYMVIAMNRTYTLNWLNFETVMSVSLCLLY